jgi:hypothetical protein
MTKFKVGQKWRTRGGDIRTIKKIKDDTKYPDETGLYVDDGTYRYPDGSFYDGETNEQDFVTLIEDAPEDDLHQCLERVEKLVEKLVVKDGVYGPFVVGKKLNGRVYVYLSTENITPNDFAQAAALFAALAMATEGVE